MEILDYRNMVRLSRLTGPARQEKLLAIAERLHPITPGQVGMMVNSNNLERALDMFERHNQKAYNAYKALIKGMPIDQRPKFRAPFWWSPNEPATQQGKWSTQLKEAFDAHL